MSHKNIAAQAAKWALDKVGCEYSQVKRNQKNVFDCSSLVARAYTAQGKQWRFGGRVPTSAKEVYDDDFELLWPENYADIGKSFGGASVLKRAQQPGDLQFLCTNMDTTRSNRITHVAMVADTGRIVHARGTRYGVCINDQMLYAGKVCAICRYNPGGALRNGMKGYRTLTLQKMLNSLGAKLEEDGEYGSATANAVKAYQAAYGLIETGEADCVTLETLGLLEDEAEKGDTRPSAKNLVKVTGGMVNIRTGPGLEYASVTIARKGEIFEAVDTRGWRTILLDGKIRWVSERYSDFTQ